MTRKTHTRTAVTALAVAAALATGAPANADPSDLRTPDARDASTSPQSGTVPVPADLRTIDARDAAQAPGGAVTRVHPRDLRVTKVIPEGFHWDDAAIGAGGTVGLALILTGGAAAISRRHRSAERLAAS